MSGLSLVAALGSLAVSLPPASAYEPSTHAILSRSAALKSRLYAGAGATGDPLFPKLGYGNPAVESFPLLAADTFGLGDLNFFSPADIVALGSRNEDNLKQTARPFNHFFDPQFNNNTGRPLTVGFALGHTSPDWAIEDRGEVVSINVPLASAGGVAQRFSYRDAQRAFYESLVRPTETERRIAFGRTLLALGHIIHHIQDMAQPQHTRNDIHAPFTSFSARYYESFTEDAIDPILEDQILAPSFYPEVGFRNIRQYWTKNTIGYKGMADFSGRNYTSFGTNYRFAPEGQPVFVLPNEDYPLPDGINVLGRTPKTIETVMVDVPNSTMVDVPNSMRQIPVKYLMGSIYDEGSDLSEPGFFISTPRRKLAAVSLLDRPARGRGVSAPVFAFDENVFMDNYPVLLPRARAFSAGIINHLFRGVGDINAERISATVWRIRARQPLNGEFAFFFENEVGNRTPITTRGFIVRGGGFVDVALGAPPANAKRMVVAYRGQVRDEVQPDGDFRGVAGIVVPITAPPVTPVKPCPRNFKASGGVEGLNTVVELGGAAGPVQVMFEAFSVPDTLDILMNDSSRRVLFSTKGLVSGNINTTIAFNPGELGPTSVMVRVGGQQRDTIWNVALSCPNSPIKPEDFPETVSVPFRFGSILTDARGSCTADVFIDGRFRLAAFVGATTGTSQPVLPVTKGKGHGIEFRNLQCTPDAQNILLGASYVDRGLGTVPLQRLNVTGVRLFDVN